MASGFWDSILLLLSRFIHAVVCICTLFFSWQNYISLRMIFRIVFIQSSVNRHVSCSPLSGYYESCCYEHSYTNLYINRMFSASEAYTQEWNPWVLQHPCENTLNCFPQQCDHFLFPPAIHEGSNFPASLLTVYCLSDQSHASGFEVVSHCCCDLPFPDD